MPLIITITDFSDIAYKATNYSCRLAADLHASVMILHPYIIPIPINDDPMILAPIAPIAPDELKGAKDSIEQMVNELKQVHAGVEITGKIVYGDLLPGIEENALPDEPFMVVIGNRDEDMSMWLGSSVVDTLRNLPYPVLAVPPDTTYKPVKKLCLAYDHKHIASQSAISRIAAMTSMLRAELHILNINNDQEQAANSIPDTFKNSISSLQPQYHIIAAAQVDEAIRSFVSDNHIDWLALIPHKHSFFERLFKKTHTEAMVQMGHVPVLAIHDKA